MKRYSNPEVIARLDRMGAWTTREGGWLLPSRGRARKPPSGRSVLAHPTLTPLWCGQCRMRDLRLRSGRGARGFREETTWPGTELTGRSSKPSLDTAWRRILKLDEQRFGNADGLASLARPRVHGRGSTGVLRRSLEHELGGSSPAIQWPDTRIGFRLPAPSHCARDSPSPPWPRRLACALAPPRAKGQCRRTPIHSRLFSYYPSIFAPSSFMLTPKRFDRLYLG